MARYKIGNQWTAEDANFVFEGVEQLLGYFPDVGEDAIRYAVMDEDIVRGESKEATSWAGKPPIDTTQTVILTLDWIAPIGLKISAGKEVHYVEREAIFVIVGAQCEDPPPPVEVDETPYDMEVTDANWLSVLHTATAATTINLPSASEMFPLQQEWTISDDAANAGTNNITIVRDGTDTLIDTETGQTTSTIIVDGGVVRIRAINSTTIKVL